MYNTMYDTFDDVEFEYNYPISFEYRNEDYLESDNPPFASWHKGDTLDIVFKISTSASNQSSNTLETALSEQQITLTLYNFRREVINTFNNATGGGTLIVDDTNSKIHWPIDKELSASIGKGIYYVGITAVDDEEVTTLVDDNKCSVYVY